MSIDPTRPEEKDEEITAEDLEIIASPDAAEELNAGDLEILVGGATGTRTGCPGPPPFPGAKCVAGLWTL